MEGLEKKGEPAKGVEGGVRVRGGEKGEPLKGFEGVVQKRGGDESGAFKRG